MFEMSMMDNNTKNSSEFIEFIKGPLAAHLNNKDEKPSRITAQKDRKRIEFNNIQIVYADHNKLEAIRLIKLAQEPNELRI